MRRIYKSIIGLFMFQIMLLALLAPLTMALESSSGGGGGDDCCSKCGDCSPEFSAVTALIALLGMAFLLALFRKRIRSYVGE
ncbi:hypothetical protein HYV82_04610 [Candidatus Woesearchaeota archaeon]|nr:hypothetical protein [Candidatus Woesearchaeota archaeon]